jgi:transcriptional regulator with XRE-family HTH domain
MDLSNFSSLLERAFLEFRIRQTRQFLSVSLNSFANYLEFSPPIVKLWLNGSRLPTQGNIERLVPKLVDLLDLEVYDILGLPRPDPDLQRLTRIWSSIPPEFRKQLADQGEKFVAESESPVNENIQPADEKIDSEDRDRDQDQTLAISDTSSIEVPSSSEQESVQNSS